MDFGQTIKTCIINIKSHKLRSILTMLGIIIGVGAFISMVAVGEGANRKIVREIKALGTNVIIVEPSLSTENASVSPGLRYSDYLRLKQDLRMTKYLAPSIFIETNVVYKGKSVNSIVECTNHSYSLIRNHPIEKGRFLMEMDGNSWEKVAVLGNNLALKLFGKEEPVGKDIIISGQRFIIVGVMKYKPQTLYIKFNDKVLIPVSTAMKFITGNQKLDKIMFSVTEEIEIDKATSEIKTKLLRYHDNRADFVVTTQEQYLSTLTETSRTLKILLGSIAAISLIVGGIGIMNIMLVSVVERKMEIGLRVALGATPEDILKQFLSESVIISMIGGIIGVFTGVFTSRGIGRLFTIILPGKEVWEAVIRPGSIVGVTIFVIIIGILAGVFPAYRALKLDPVDCLRY